MKLLRVTYGINTVKYEIINKGQKDLIKEIDRLPDVDYVKEAERYMEKHGLDAMEYASK